MMQPSDFKQRLRDLGLTQEEFGALVFSPVRTVNYWATASVRVPGPVEAVVRLLERRPELVEVMREISATERAKA